MGELIGNATEKSLDENGNKVDMFDSNAHLLLTIYRNISLVLEAIRAENDKHHLLHHIPSKDTRQGNYII